MGVPSIFEEHATLSEVVRFLQKKLVQTGEFSQEEAWRDARLLVAEALKISTLMILSESSTPLSCFSASLRAQLEHFVVRRIQGEPLSRIRARRSFWRNEFIISPATLDPRPETEGIIELALRFFKGKKNPKRILDLGTGSGCLLLSLLQEFPDAYGVGVDCSCDALKIARQNAQELGLCDRSLFQEGNWLEGIEEEYDLIVSNPPYIPSHDIPFLSVSVRQYDPLNALDGGKDGLEPYRIFVPGVAHILSAEGLFLLECGLGQSQFLEHLLKQHFSDVCFLSDISKIERYGQASHAHRIEI